MNTRSTRGLRHAYVVVAVAALLGVVGPANVGCSLDECSDGESRCEGDVMLLSCGVVGNDISGKRSFHQRLPCKAGTHCIGTTKGGTGYAVCSATTAPDARCAGGSDARCAQNNLLQCDMGFSDGGSPCDAVCVQPQAGSGFCAVSKDPNTSCRLDASPHPTFCEADRVARCNESGYVLKVEGCPSESPNCVEDKPGRAVCAVARDPDPRCASTPRSSWCEGSTLFVCSETGYVTAQRCSGDTPDCVVQVVTVDKGNFTVPACGVAP